MTTPRVRVLPPHGLVKRFGRGLCPRNPSRGAVSEGGGAPRRGKYGAKTPKAGGAA